MWTQSLTTLLVDLPASSGDLASLLSECSITARVGLRWRGEHDISASRDPISSPHSYITSPISPACHNELKVFQGPLSYHSYQRCCHGQGMLDPWTSLGFRGLCSREICLRKINRKKYLFSDRGPCSKALLNLITETNGRERELSPLLPLTSTYPLMHSSMHIYNTKLPLSLI